MERRTKAGRWIFGACAGVALFGAAGAAHADGAPRFNPHPEVTVQSVFRMPPPEAIGAAVGAVAAVQIANVIRARRKKRGLDRSE
jgi:hypothetical protein